MEHWSHEQQDGGQARDEGVTEKIFALGMGLASVRSWPQQTSQTDKRTRSPFMAAAMSQYISSSDFRITKPKQATWTKVG